MSKVVYVLSIVLLLSLHACNARHLSLAGKRIGRKSHTIDKDVHSKKHRSSFMLTHSEPKVVQAQEHSTVGANELKNTVMRKDSELVILKKGGEVETSYLQEATQKEGGRTRQARSTLESSPNEAKEIVNSKENHDIADDVVAMDYAQPHRKPPIHNRKL